MGFFNNLFGKNNQTKKHTIHTILCTGRDMGRFSTNIEEGKHFSIGSGVKPVLLTKHEYGAWRQLRSSKTIDEWYEKCLEKKMITSKEELDVLRQKFQEEFLLLEWDGKLTPEAVLKEFTVTNNGKYAGFSEENQKWVVMSVAPKDKGVAMTQEQYDMWRSAIGVQRMIDVIHQFKRLTGCNTNEAKQLFFKYAQQYAKAGLWNIEYCGEDEALYANNHRETMTSNKDWFNSRLVEDTTLLISIGEEFIVGNESERVPYVKAGKKEIRLEADEMLIWAACKNDMNSVANLAKLYHQSNITVKEIISKLMEKKVIMIWPNKWNGTEDDTISIKPTGIGVGSNDGKVFQIADLTNGNIQKIPVSAYSIWVMAHSCMPLQVMVSNFQQLFSTTEEEAEKQVSEWIPLLLKSGLAHLQMIPRRDV
ncbi:hypothetical protein BTR23_04080 [Alkalihalophilus pseudofirmus]|nr:hypothetical protein BTR23_04080 [Alkalihalophilus pseudofirmus]